jgi:hypothetical protein
MMFTIRIAETEKHFELDVHSDIMGDVPVEIISSNEEGLRKSSKVRTRLRAVQRSILSP